MVVKYLLTPFLTSYLLLLVYEGEEVGCYSEPGAMGEEWNEEFQ